MAVLIVFQAGGFDVCCGLDVLGSCEDDVDQAVEPGELNRNELLWTVLL